MKTMKWLLRREFWEHKGAMLWAPVVAGALLLVAMTASLGFALHSGKFGGRLVINGKEKDVVFSLASALNSGGAIEMIANLYLAFSAPLFILMAAVVFFYCLSALHDERRDRSILFWKSLPVSDAQTVASKVITAAIVAPLITIGISVFLSLLLIAVAGVLFALQGVNIIGPLLSQPAFYLAPLRLLALLPVYLLWALPTIGWLLLVSSWAKSKVFLWAVGTPVLAVIALKWVDFLTNVGINMDWVMQHILGRGLLGLVPGAWFSFEQIQPDTLIEAGSHSVTMANVFTQSWLTLAGPNVWIGAVAGAAMIVAAARLRRWKDEG